MQAIVRIALSRPYTFVVMALLILIFGPLAALRTPTDIFPNIKHAGDRRGLAVHRPVARRHGRAGSSRRYERMLPTRSTTSSTSRAHSIPGIGIVQDLLPARRRHPHGHRPGDLGLPDRAEADAAGHPAAADPQLQRLHRADPAARARPARRCPSSRCSTPRRTSSARRSAPCRARRCPIPTAGESRQVQIDLDPAALQSKGLSARTWPTPSPPRTRSPRSARRRSAASQYDVKLNNAPPTIDELNDLPIKTVNGATIFMRDVAHVRDGSPPQTNMVHVDGAPRGADDRAEDRLGLDPRHRPRRQGAAAAAQGARCRDACKIIADQRPVAVREGGGLRRGHAKASSPRP